MKHHIACATAVLGLTILITGCTNDSKPTARPPTPPPATASPAPTLPAEAPTYSMPASLCTAADASAFADLVPTTAKAKASEIGRSQTARHTSATCVTAFGTLSKTVLVSIGVDLFTDTPAAQGNFYGFRGVVLKDSPNARDVTGAGTAAYFYDDPNLGPHLVVQFGNANITVSAIAMGESKQLPADTESRLITTAKATLGKLPHA